VAVGGMAVCASLCLLFVICYSTSMFSKSPLLIYIILGGDGGGGNFMRIDAIVVMILITADYKISLII